MENYLQKMIVLQIKNVSNIKIKRLSMTRNASKVQMNREKRSN